MFFGIDAAKPRQIVARFIPGEGVKPAEGMTVDTLIKRVAQRLKRGGRVHCVSGDGPCCGGWRSSLEASRAWRGAFAEECRVAAGLRFAGGDPFVGRFCP